MMVNDSYDEEEGELALTLEAEDGREVARATVPFSVAPLGALSRDLALEAPDLGGEYVLKATATTSTGSTVSRRKLSVVAAPEVAAPEEAAPEEAAPEEAAPEEAALEEAALEE
jgi:hypothetical protein